MNWEIMAIIMLAVLGLGFLIASIGYAEDNESSKSFVFLVLCALTLGGAMGLLT